MTEKIFNNIRIVHKHDTEANWLNTNFIPKQGELIIYDIDNQYNYERFKIGDGKTNLNLLPFGTEDIDWNNLKNKPFYDTKHSLYYSYSGQYENYEHIKHNGIAFIKVSNDTPSIEDLVGAKLKYVDNKNVFEITMNENGFTDHGNIYMYGLGFVICCLSETAVYPSFPEVTFTKGLYFIDGSLDGFNTINGVIKEIYKELDTGIIKQLDERFIPEDSPANWDKLINKPFGENMDVDIFPKERINFELEPSLSLYYCNANFKLDLDKTYYVEWDGKTYICKSNSINFMGQDAIAIGNFMAITGNDTGEPFAIGYIPASNQSSILAYTSEESHIVRIYKTHQIKQIDKKFIPDMNDIFYVNCTTVATAADFIEGDIIYLPITTDKTFAEIKAATKAGKTPVANWSWLTENGIMLAAYLLNSYDTDIDDDFIYFNTVDVDSSGTILKTKIIICNPDPNFIHEITEDSVELSIIQVKSSQSDWNQSDPEGKGYIKNRTHYMSDGAAHYNCNSYNEYAASADVVIEDVPMLVKISDFMLTEEQLMEVETSITINDIYSEESAGLIVLEGTEKKVVTNDNMIMATYAPYLPEDATEDEQSMVTYGTTYLISAKAGSVISSGDDVSITIPEDGTYALNYFLEMVAMLSKTIPEMVTLMGMIFNNWEVKYGEIKQLSTTYIPSTIARTGNVLTKAEAMIYLNEVYAEVETKVTIPDTGLVGQVLAVKTVDENGKPTAFETIDGVNSNDFFYVNCVSKVADFDGTIEDNVHFDITTDKTFGEIKAAVNEGKTPIAIFKWLNENNNNSVIDILVFTDYGTDLDGDFIYFSSPTIDSAGIGKYLITICNPNPTYVHEITKDQISYKEVNVNMGNIDTLELITVADIDAICGTTIQMASEVKF